MGDGWFESLARALAVARPRRGVLRIASLLTRWVAVGAALLGDETAAKKSTRKHRKKRKKRRRRRNACKLLSSGAECAESAQCCSGTCDENTAFPQFDTVCCQAEGANCVIGRNECCRDFACHCTTPGCRDFNGAPGVCS